MFQRNLDGIALAEQIGAIAAVGQGIDLALLAKGTKLEGLIVRRVDQPRDVLIAGGGSQQAVDGQLDGVVMPDPPGASMKLTVPLALAASELMETLPALLCEAFAFKLVFFSKSAALMVTPARISKITATISTIRFTWPRGGRVSEGGRFARFCSACSFRLDVAMMTISLSVLSIPESISCLGISMNPYKDNGSLLAPHWRLYFSGPICYASTTP